MGNRLFLVLLISAGIQLPYLDQAFHIDDNVFLMIAENTSNHFWFPQDLRTYFEGLLVESFISHEHPLLLSSFLIAPALRQNLVSSEIAAHTVFLSFFLILVASTYLLATRVTSYPGTAALLTAVSPAVFVSSHTVMVDVPFAALIYLALALIISADSRFRLVAAGLSCAGAVMLAYQALFFVPLVSLRIRTSSRWRYAVWLVPMSSLVLYGLVNSVYFERFIWWDLIAFWYQQPASGGGFPPKIAHAFLALAAAIIFPAGWLLILRRPRRSKASDQFAATGDESGERAVLISLFGIIVVNVFLILFVYHVGTVRYWIPAVPAICILIIRMVENVIGLPWRRYVASGLVLSTAVLSVLLANADHEWANFYRDVEAVVASYKHRGTQVWITGEWGFRWYATRAGAKVLGRADNRPQPGDILIRPRIASPYRTIYDSHEAALELERTIEYYPTFPVRLLDFESNAGFYSSGWGLLPYSVSFDSRPLELIAIYRIKKHVAKPVDEPTYWDWNRE